MSIQIRRLNPEEYPLLKTVDDGFSPDPKRSIAIVADNGDHIIGRIFLVAPTHCEGVFIERPWRNSQMLSRLVNAVEFEARSEGITRILAYSKDEQMSSYISRLGYKKLEMTVWSKELPTCPPQ